MRRIFFIVVLLMVVLRPCAGRAASAWEVRSCGGAERLDTTRSKFIRAGLYCADDKSLIIDVEGTVKRYCGVPAEIWHALGAATDLGRFYNLNIKDRYACTSP